MRPPPLMQERLENLTDEDLLALSAYYASGPARPSSPVAGNGSQQGRHQAGP
jgi:cytochrome c553